MRLRSKGALIALLACLFLPLLGAHAAAANHPFLFSIFEFRPEPNKLERFENPCGLTVDESGNVYVSDYYHGDVDVFTAGGSLLTRLLDVDPIDGPCGLAVTASGRLFVNDFHRQVLGYVPAAFPLASKTAYGGPTTVDAAHSTGVAYDPSSDRVFVNDRNWVAVYDSTGTPVMDGTDPLRIGVGALGNAYGVAVSAYPGTQGYVYVADAADRTVKVFDPTASTSTPIGIIDGRGTPQGGFPTLRDASLAIDHADGHLYVVYNAQGPFYEHPRAAIAEYNPAGEYRGSVASPTPIRFGEPGGIAVDNSAGPTKGRVYVTTGNSEMSTLPPARPEESAVYAFGPGAPGERLEVAFGGAGSGDVSSAPAGISCPGACAAEFDAGATVTLTAEAVQGSGFAGWSGGGCAGTGTCVVTMSAAATVTADFEPSPASTSEAAGTQAALPAAAAPVDLSPPIAATAPPVEHRIANSRPGAVLSSASRAYRGSTAQKNTIRLSVTSKAVTLRRVTIRLRCLDGGVLYDDLEDFEPSPLRRRGRFSDVQFGAGDVVRWRGRVRRGSVRGKIRVKDRLESGVSCDSGFVGFAARPAG